MKTLYRRLSRSSLHLRQKQYLFLMTSSASGFFMGAVILLAFRLCGMWNAGTVVSCMLLPFIAMFINAGLYLCRHDFSFSLTGEGKRTARRKHSSRIISA